MATKKRAGTPRFKSVEPSKLPAWAANYSRAWSNLDRLRIEAYRIALPNLPAEIVQAVRAGDHKQLNEIMRRADSQWTEATGMPAITPSNLEDVMAVVQQAGYPATDAGLRVWTTAKMKAKPIERDGRNKSRSAAAGDYRKRFKCPPCPKSKSCDCRPATMARK